jgi:hypothetical protein
LGGVTVFGFSSIARQTVSVVLPQIGQTRTNRIGKTCENSNREMPFLVSIIERRLGTKRLPIHTSLRLVADALSYALPRVSHFGTNTEVEYPLLYACSTSAALTAAGKHTHLHHIRRLQRSCISLRYVYLYTEKMRRMLLVPESGPKRTFGETVPLKLDPTPALSGSQRPTAHGLLCSNNAPHTH